MCDDHGDEVSNLSCSTGTDLSHDAAADSITSQACGHCIDPVAHRLLGRIRRKPGAGRRHLAYFGSGCVLSIHGNCVDHPTETIDKMDADRAVELAFRPTTLNLLC
jgi:hypothetical protein